MDQFVGDTNEPRCDDTVSLVAPTVRYAWNMNLEARSTRATHLRQTPSWLMMQAGTVTNRFVTAAYGSVGATRHEYAILSVLGDIEAATQADLGRHCHLDRSDIAGTISALERAECVVRRENPSDRRQKLVSITSRGRERLGAIAAALTAAQDKLLIGMSSTDRKKLAELLVGVLDRHDAAPPAE